LGPERLPAGRKGPATLDAPMAETGSPPRRGSLVVSFSVLALAAAVAAAVLLGVDQRLAAFIAACGAGSFLILVGWRAREARDPRLRFTDSLAERGVDAVILGTLAWTALPDEPGVAAAALAALVTSYLASYLRARAVGLRFRVEEPLLLRSVRVTFVAVAVLGPPAQISLLVVMGVSLQAIVLRAAAVARQKEPG
jgi:hypothetical protein